VEPVTLIVAALAAGALKGVGETATAAVKDAYQELRRRVAARFAGNPTAELVLAEHEADPDAYEKALAKQVTESGAVTDQEVIAAAQRLMAIVDEAGSRIGKYVVDVHGGQGVVIGDHAHVDQSFGTPLPGS
jgi:hypothetical protein